MSELVWINGEVMPLADARIGVEDRGFQFADGVYEVIRVYNGKPFTLDLHLQRLASSAKEILLPSPIEMGALAGEIRKFLSLVDMPDAMVYLQLTRGCMPRNHAFGSSKPTLLFYVRPLEPMIDAPASEGNKLITVPDDRWQRCYIKSIALLPNVLAKNLALAAGADEAVFLDDGRVTECASCNIFAVINQRVVTHPVGKKVLPGITRAVLLELAPGIGVQIEERPFSKEEAAGAGEMFITSTIREVGWVARWNDHVVGDGKCGPITRKLRAALRQKIVRETA